MKYNIVSGGFDPLHEGHIAMIRAAAKLRNNSLKNIGQSSRKEVNMKTLLAFLHRVLEHFPLKVHDKVIIIAKVLLQDWRIQPYVNYCSPQLFCDLMQTKPEELDLFDDLDPLSRQTVEKFIRDQLSACIKNHPYFFYQMKDYYTPQEEKEGMRLYRMLKKQQGFFHLGNEGDLSSLVLGHGLELLEPEVRKYIAGKVFIDAGAYIGDSCLGLQRYNPKKVLSFEISGTSMERYRKVMSLNHIPDSAYELIHAGLNDKGAQITDFQDTAEPGTRINSPSGHETIELLPLDEFLMNRDEPVGFLKTDVEGAGVAVLRGAEMTIRRYRPVLSLGPSGIFVGNHYSTLFVPDLSII